MATCKSSKPMLAPAAAPSTPETTKFASARRIAEGRKLAIAMLTEMHEYTNRTNVPDAGKYNLEDGDISDAKRQASASEPSMRSSRRFGTLSVNYPNFGAHTWVRADWRIVAPTLTNKFETWASNSSFGRVVYT